MTSTRWKVGQRLRYTDGSERFGEVRYVDPNTGEGVALFEGALYLTLLRPMADMQVEIISEGGANL